MDPNFAAILASWSFAPWLALSLGVSAVVYVRGWLRLRRRGAAQFDGTKLACFFGGLTTIYVALMSPLDALAPLLMQAHMVQHLLLMLVAPPLILLAAPELPMIAGMPEYVRQTWVIPLWQLPALRRFAGWLTRPVTAWVIAVGILWLWHVPAMYEWTLRDRLVHDIEHFTFLASSLLFWWPVLTPYPRSRAYSAWLLLPYLFLAGIQGSILGGVLTFADHVLYPHYEQAPRLWGLSALSDQAIGGAIMWTLGSLAYLVPLIIIGRRLLRTAVPPYPSPCSPSRVPLALPVLDAGDALQFHRTLCSSASLFLALPVLQDISRPHSTNTGRASGTRKEGARCGSVLDLVRVPLLGPVLRARHTRTILQYVFFALALVVIIDGLSGPQVAPINVAGVGPWIQWRWLVVVGLLVAGNVFCMVCPFTLPRRVAAAWLPMSWSWPQWLSGKGPAIALLVLFFWAYELLALWNSPWWTAWIVIGYFAAALVIDGLFRGTPFCRYVCPIGQFNFVYSLFSPLEVKVRDPATCQHCTSHACLRGSDTIAGCETGLFQPQKRGNMDCTFCLDCVRSCPHENVGVMIALPSSRLEVETTRFGVSQQERLDATALVVVLTAAAFVSAAWMTAPRVAVESQASQWLGPLGAPVLVTVGTLLGIVVAPLLAVSSVAAASRTWAGDHESWWANARRFACALAPLGLGMWAAHYTYHFLTGGGTIVTAAVRLAADLGLTAAGARSWACPCCSGQLNSWLLPSQFLLLDAGLIVSLYVAYAVARRRFGRSRRALAFVAPWGLLLLLLFGIGVAILLTPMEMRGTIAALGRGL